MNVEPTIKLPESVERPAEAPFAPVIGSPSGRTRQTSFLTGRILVWFSCGAASAVAAKLAADKYRGDSFEVIYCNLAKDEHEDNARFRADVEKWIGLPVKVIGSTKYTSIEEVWEDKQYMAGIGGAPCTAQMKKVPRFAYQWAEDVHIFGLTADEQSRIKSFEDDNHELNLEWPLRDAGLDKPDCLQLLTDAGIELPGMYRLGFENNNCIGCVKATSARYWNRVRKYFPAVFKRRCEQSRRLGVRLVRYKGVRIFLDELPEDATDQITEDLSCGPQCAGARMENDQAQRPGLTGR